MNLCMYLFWKQLNHTKYIHLPIKSPDVEVAEDPEFIETPIEFEAL